MYQCVVYFILKSCNNNIPTYAVFMFLTKQTTIIFSCTQMFLVLSDMNILKCTVANIKFCQKYCWCIKSYINCTVWLSHG